MMLRTGNKSRRNNGFTLIELVLVILLISILTMLSTPLFRRTFSGLVLKNASFNLAETINYAQQMAIIEKVTYRLNLDFKNGKYWITKYSPPEEEDEGPLYKRIKGRYGKEYRLPEGLRFSCDKKEVSFYPDGRSDRVKIEIRDENTKEAYLLHVKGFRNRIRAEAIKE